MQFPIYEEICTNTDFLQIFAKVSDIINNFVILSSYLSRNHGMLLDKPARQNRKTV